LYRPNEVASNREEAEESMRKREFEFWKDHRVKIIRCCLGEFVEEQAFSWSDFQEQDIKKGERKR
jgi:hypothetical protein